MRRMTKVVGIGFGSDLDGFGFGLDSAWIRIWILMGFGLDWGCFVLAGLWQTGHGNGKTSSRPAAIVISNPKWIHLDQFRVVVL